MAYAFKLRSHLIYVMISDQQTDDTGAWRYTHVDMPCAIYTTACSHWSNTKFILVVQRSVLFKV